MNSSYFHRVARETPTRVWVNNPTGAEIDKALAAGAVSGTTNPSYCSKLIQKEPDYIRNIINQVISDVEDDDEAADLIYQKASSRFMNKFLPQYKQGGEEQGFVTIQYDPRRDEDPDKIVNASLRHCRLGKNYMAKIPVTIAGMEAMAVLIEKNIPITATECFSISQMISMCELYKRVSSDSGKHPPLFITHISGIFDDALKDYVKQNRIDIEPQLLDQVGCIVARKQYRILKERKYEATMLGGGARGTHHFTSFVGADMHITLNWSTMQELIELDGPVENGINTETPEEVVTELCSKLPDFLRAYKKEALSPGDFTAFAPIQRFRNSFIDGYNNLLNEITQCRVG